MCVFSSEDQESLFALLRTDRLQPSLHGSACKSECSLAAISRTYRAGGTTHRRGHCRGDEGNRSIRRGGGTDSKRQWGRAVGSLWNGTAASAGGNYFAVLRDLPGTHHEGGPLDEL